MTQNERILKYMKENDGITTMDAIRLGCTRLAARIAELEARGHGIRHERVTQNKKTFTCYRLEEVRKDG